MTTESWLSESLIRDILKDEYDEEFKIINFTTERVVTDNEHYGCNVKRLIVNLQLADDKEITKRYVLKSVKVSPYSGYVGVSLYPKDRDMSVEIIPKFESLFKNAGETIKLAPACYKVDDETETILLEDLTDQEFVVEKREWGMDLKHAEAALEKLAQFHAASACIFERDGPYSDKFREGIYLTHMIPMYEHVLEAVWDSIESSMQRWAVHEDLRRKLKRQKEDMITLQMESLDCDPNEFNVLNHGDFWLNNIMFQYNDDASIKQVLFVDFQLSKWGSPTQDLLHFLVLSCCREVRVVQFDHLIAHYHEHLTKNLDLLRYKGKVPTLDDIQEQLRKRGYYGVSTAVSILPAIFREPEGSTMNIYANEKYFEAMKTLVPYFDKLGLLDKTVIHNNYERVD